MLIFYLNLNYYYCYYFYVVFHPCVCHLHLTPPKAIASASPTSNMATIEFMISKCQKRRAKWRRRVMKVVVLDLSEGSVLFGLRKANQEMVGLVAICQLSAPV